MDSLLSPGGSQESCGGRKLLDSVKPTGGWPYWHYRDEITGQWENLSHLSEQRALREPRTVAPTDRRSPVDRVTYA